MFSFIFRYWSALRLCWISRQGRLLDPYGRLIPKWRDLCMLRLLQAFLQSAPQAVFQLYVLCRKGSFVVADDLVIAIAAVTSLITVVWSLVCYSKALRDLRDNAQDLPWIGFTCQVLWRAFMVISRVVALVLFASHFQQWTLLAVLGHWMLMAMWLACQRTQFCIDENGRGHPCKERIFNCVIAFIYVFCFFNTKEGMTRKRIVLFYSVMLVENSLLISMWYPNRNLNSVWTYSALSVVWGGFVLGVVFMILYYKFYHHSHAFKGLFIRTKTFNLHGRKMYGLYFCCCCRLKKWDVAIYDCSDDSVEPVVRPDQALPTNRQDNPYEVRMHWDNDDIQMRPLNGSCIRGDGDFDQDMLIQHPFIPEDDLVPDIVVTAASPLVLSPQESLGRLSLDHAIPEEDPVNEHDDPPLSPGQTSLDKAREILASKLNKDTDSHEDANEDEDEIPKINYGTVSFGNRYSLVSSDCISISSESSLSSFTNSLNDLLDRMGVAPKNETEQKEDLKVSPADEGIYSDERESPAKSGNTESESSPSHNAQSRDNMVNGHIAMPNDSPRKDESFDVLESMMDAPSSPYVTKKKRTRDKDEGSESESTDASSDDRERRHSCEDLDFSFLHSTPKEDKTKRHSLDIADLSSNYKRAKKKGRNKRRFNKIIIFDNFVSSALKPGKFGSLRKSYERLSKITEDTEESAGLLSNDSLKDNRNPHNNDLPSLRNEEEVKNIEPSFHGDSSSSEHNNSSINEIVENNESEEDINDDKEIIENLSPVHNNVIGKGNPLDNAIQEIEEDKTNPYLQNTNDLNGEISSSTDSDRSSDDQSDKGLLIEDLVPSRFSTVRRSHEHVPLACCEDFDDDLGSSMEDDINMENDETPPRLVSPPSSDKNISFHRDSSVESLADSESCRKYETMHETINRSIASSGSSIFENILFLDNEHSSLPEGQTRKRHTFDFGAHRKARPVKRLGSSSSQSSLPRSAGSPIWVRKTINTHRRRKPKTSQNNKNDEFIQEVRV